MALKFGFYSGEKISATFFCRLLFCFFFFDTFCRLLSYLLFNYFMFVIVSQSQSQVTTHESNSPHSAESTCRLTLLAGSHVHTFVCHVWVDLCFFSLFFSSSFFQVKERVKGFEQVQEIEN